MLVVPCAVGCGFNICVSEWGDENTHLAGSVPVAGWAGVCPIAVATSGSAGAEVEQQYADYGLALSDYHPQPRANPTTTGMGAG